VGKEKGVKDSKKALPPSIIINDDAINKQLGLSTENAGTAAAAATESSNKPNTLPNLAVPAVSLPPERIEVDFIQVNPSYSTLKDEFLSCHRTITVAIELLVAFEANPDFQSGEPTEDMLSFLDRIENADPNSPDLSEDDLNASWGHYQFTAGGQTISTVLTSWKSVGNTSVAHRLLVAALKTSKVARHVCFERAVEPSSFLSDVYVQLLVDKLLDLWKDAGGSISKEKGTDKDGALGASLPTSNIVPVQAASTGRAEPDAMLVDPTASGSGDSSESAVKTASFDVRKILQSG
ncbi:hypothetical protein K443DRAFT_13285, partial [Laccaria amethystina LaAM-08-1]